MVVLGKLRIKNKYLLMKRLLLFMTFICLSVVLIGQTGPGWSQMNSKYNFRSNVHFVKIPLFNSTDTLASRIWVRSLLTTYDATSKADTSLSNLSSVAINTHLLPASSGSANLGSVSLPFGNIYAGATVLSKLNIGSATSATKAEVDSTVIFDGQLADFVGPDTTNRYRTVAGRHEANLIIKMLNDTALFISPVIGVGNAGDTLGFTLNNVIWGTKWGGSHSLVITKVTGVVYGTTPDIDVALLYDANFRDGTPTEVFSSDLTITSTTTGNDATINASNDTIAPDTWLWLRIDQATAKPTQCVINIYGYLE